MLAAIVLFSTRMDVSVAEQDWMQPGNFIRYQTFCTGTNVTDTLTIEGEYAWEISAVTSNNLTVMEEVESATISEINSSIIFVYDISTRQNSNATDVFSHIWIPINVTIGSSIVIGNVSFSVAERRQVSVNGATMDVWLLLYNSTNLTIWFEYETAKGLLIQGNASISGEWTGYSKFTISQTNIYSQSPSHSISIGARESVWMLLIPCSVFWPKITKRQLFSVLMLTILIFGAMMVSVRATTWTKPYSINFETPADTAQSGWGNKRTVYNTKADKDTGKLTGNVETHIDFPGGKAASEGAWGFQEFFHVPEEFVYEATFDFSYSFDVACVVKGLGIKGIPALVATYARCEINLEAWLNGANSRRHFLVESHWFFGDGKTFKKDDSLVCEDWIPECTHNWGFAINVKAVAVGFAGGAEATIKNIEVELKKVTIIPEVEKEVKECYRDWYSWIMMDDGSRYIILIGTKVIYPMWDRDPGTFSARGGTYVVR
jgi:hypothetical protein